MMQLGDWMILKKMKITKLAKALGISHGLIYQYLYANVIPRREILDKIFFLTDGLVTASDFLQHTPERLKKGF